jgi:hypothetical protein
VRDELLGVELFSCLAEAKVITIGRRGVVCGTLVAGASLGTSSVVPAGARQAAARTARTLSLNETRRLHLTSKHGFTLNEEAPHPARSKARSTCI